MNCPRVSYKLICSSPDCDVSRTGDDVTLMKSLSLYMSSMCTLAPRVRVTGQAIGLALLSFFGIIGNLWQYFLGCFARGFVCAPGQHVLRDVVLLPLFTRQVQTPASHRGPPPQSSHPVRLAPCRGARRDDNFRHLYRPVSSMSLHLLPRRRTRCSLLSTAQLHSALRTTRTRSWRIAKGRPEDNY